MSAKLSLRISVAILAVAAVALLAVGTRAASAPSTAMFRGGPSHNAIYAGGGRTLRGLAWRAATEGDVVSSPAIVDGVVYVGSNDGGLYALDLAGGARRWRAELGSPVSSSPAVGGGLVYAATRDGSVTAVDARTGDRRWRLRTGALLRFPWGHESGDYYVSSPTLADGLLLFGAGDGGVYAVDAATGTRRWRTQTAGRIRGTPAVHAGRVYVGAFDGRVYCLDLETGAVRWRAETEGASLESGRFGFDRRSIQSSPAVANGVVYVGARDGFLYALDAGTGARRWRFDHHVSWVITSPAVVDGVVYAGSSDGHFVQAVDADGTERWHTPVDGLVWSSPSVAGGIVYVGDGVGWLYALDRATGAPRWKFRTGSGIYGSPAISGPYVVFGSTDGSIYALRADDGPPVRRAVFYDSAFAQRSHLDRGEATARYLANRGYHPLDSAQLDAFLRERIADRAPSVVVFAMDYAPASVVAAPPESSLLRRYLDAGGKVVWSGAPPAIFPLQQPPNALRLDWSTSSALTGVPHDSALFDRHGVRATPAGTRWGLPAYWRDAWAVDAHGATTVLGVNDDGLAAAWVRRFGGAEGTGFVRIPADDLLAVYLAAEYRN